MSCRFEAAEARETSVEDSMVAGEPAAHRVPTLEISPELAGELGADNAMQWRAEGFGGTLADLPPEPGAPARRGCCWARAQMVCRVLKLLLPLLRRDRPADQHRGGTSHRRCGWCPGAVAVTWQQGMDDLEPAHQQALLRNLLLQRLGLAMVLLPCS